MGGRTDDQGAQKILADHFRDTKNETQKQLNNTQNHHEQTKLQKRISSLDVPRDRTQGQRELEEVRVVQEENIKRLQKIKGWLNKTWQAPRRSSSKIQHRHWS